MRLNEHSELVGKHSTFSPSQPEFFNYDQDTIVDRMLSKYSSQLGTDIHEWVCLKILRKHKIKTVKEMVTSIDEYLFNKYFNKKYRVLSKDGKRILDCFVAVKHDRPEIFGTIKDYVNDAIDFDMVPEVVVYFTDDLFGTADTLIFEDRVLRIHDLKTGSSPVHIEQLLAYAALFCIEYKVDPFKIECELRIYQNDDVLVATPDGNDIKSFIDIYYAINKQILAYEGGRS